MQPLEVVPLEICSSAEALLRHLLRAGHKQAGLLLVAPSNSDQYALRGLIQQGLREAEAGGVQESNQVEPSRFPAAARALHRLGSLLTEGTMLSWGENPYSLHPHLDDVNDWLCPSLSSSEWVHSRILLSTSRFLEEHVDRGLLNVVLGTADDLAAIVVNVNGNRTPVHSLLPDGTDEDAILGLVIPGFTLQALDPRNAAIPHSVDIHKMYPRMMKARSSVVLQWRLSPSYVIDGTSVDELMAQFWSVRAQQRAEAARRLEQEMVPTIKPETAFFVNQSINYI